MQERWLPVPISGFAHVYMVSDQGRIRSLPRRLRDGRYISGRILKASLNGSGRFLVVLQHDCHKHCCFVYQLVTGAFLGPLSHGHCINHKNGDPTDDRLENLEYVTPAENSRHAADVLHAFPLGEKHPGSKLTVSDVLHRICARGLPLLSGRGMARSPFLI